MNLSTIAKLANVSVSTVSKAFSDSKEVSDETRGKILDIAKELGLYDKYYKGKYKRTIIAIIVPELNSQFYYSIISEFNQILQQKNCTILVSVSNFDREIEKELLRYFATFGHSDGIIFIGESPKNIDFHIDIPVIAIGNTKDFDCVYYNFTDAMDNAIRHLKENGHRNIAFIGEKYTSKKHAIFKKTMLQNCLTIKNEWLITSDKRFEEAGYQAMNQLFEGKSLPTAIVAAYDYIALGIYQSIYEHGYSVPDDFSIIGMDDIDVIQNINPPLTSIGTHPRELCQVVCDLMLKKLENKFYTLKQGIAIKTELRKRNSVKNIK